MMQCEVLTLFPELINGIATQSILKRAQDKGLVRIRAIDIRMFTKDRHRVADDAPYGGGSGMVMKAEPIFQAIDTLEAEGQPLRLIYPSPQGRPFSQALAKDLSRETKRLVWICGHYEGVDERVLSRLEPEEISLGDYVLTGGELPTMVMIDAAARFVPGVIGDPISVQQDSFADGLLDYPHYTRPECVRGYGVPEVLLSGHHEAIHQWRRKESLRNTYYKRPDVLNEVCLTEEDREMLREISQECGTVHCVSQRED